MAEQGRNVTNSSAVANNGGRDDVSEQELMELQLTDIAHGGVCVGRQDDGRVVFVRGGIPGERVQVRMTESKKRFRSAVVENVVEASPHRCEHPWPAGAAGVTGAADFGHIDLDFQRALKGAVVATQVKRIGGEALAEQLAGWDLTALGIGFSEGFSVDFSEGRPHTASAAAVVASGSHAGDAHASDVAGPGWHTRTRFDVVKMETGVGMYREHSHELVRLADMPLAVRELTLLDLFGSSWDHAIVPGTRLHVVAPASGENVVVTLANPAKGVHALVASPERIALAASEQPYVLHERASDGSDLYEYDLSPAGFWQVHHAAPSALLSRVMPAAGLAGGERVLELFAGAGLFSLPVARAIGKRGELLTLEGSEQAVADAAGNLARYPWAHAHQSWIDARAVRRALDQVQPELVIADPPRSGLGRASAQAIALADGVQRMILISCDPAAMARDAGVFTAAGWIVKSCEVLDLFPHTHHVETLMLMSRV